MPSFCGVNGSLALLLLFVFQICGNADGQQVLLSTPRILEPFLFSKLMTVRDIRERIALQPQAPCLNLK